MHHLNTVLKMGTAYMMNTLVKPVSRLPFGYRISPWNLAQTTSFGCRCACHKSLAENRTTLKLCPVTFQYNEKRHFTSFTKLHNNQNPIPGTRSNRTTSGAKECEHENSLQQKTINDGARTSVVSDVKESDLKDKDHSQLSMSELEDLYKDATFQPIFQFPLILVVRLISRLKIVQTFLTIMVLPPVTYGYLSGTTSLTFVQISYSVATLAAAVLYGMSYYFRRLIGVVSISEDDKVIRVGRLTFWGNRKNLFYCVDDVVPLSDLPDNLNDVLIKFKTYKDPTLLYISLTHGKVKDKKKFAKVFGSMK